VIVWLVGGIDPTRGAGLDRDVATLRAVAPEAIAIELPTAHTQQGHGAPATATAVDARALLAGAAASPPPDAIKVGLVPADVAHAVAEILALHAVPSVVDPVLAASDGGTMGARADALAPVLARATVITPNRSEAAQLTGRAADDPGLLDALAERFTHAWVLLKDGHGADPARVCDHLVHGSTRRDFSRPRVPGPDPRGTGCALATAIACGLARGHAVPRAVGEAIAWLDDARTRTHPGPDGRRHLIP
jgi:hydroxymethylpyrimidine/phosphomethylpyrimidine kinase